MNQKALRMLEYGKIIESLIECAQSSLGKEMIEKLNPSTNLEGIKTQLLETTEAKAMIKKNPRIPLNGLDGFEKVMVKIGKNHCLHPQDFTHIGDLLDGSKRLKAYCKNMDVVAPLVSDYIYSMADLTNLEDEIKRCIANGRVLDKASGNLHKTRKKMNVLEERIKSKLNGYINSAQSKYLQDKLISSRDGRYVLPVKQEYKNSIEGSVLDSSRTGSTIFVEPIAVRRLQDELNTLKAEEEKEIHIILSTLTVKVEENQQEIKIIVETMATYDFLFAKARYSSKIGGNPVNVTEDNKVNIVQGKHPLLGHDAVPLDFEIGNSYRSLIITGPNTGGKTVVLKTVGLLTLMVQSGLHIPASNESSLSIFLNILTDIGDGQSIEQSLSTFSSHIKNIIEILACTEPNTLVLIDEIGTGTDPSEGSGLAMAILEEIYNKGATTIASTHYSEIKTFAADKEGFENGSMGFDINTLKPLYRLSIGIAGESNGFLIALRLGIKKELVKRAHKLIYKEDKEYDINFPGTFKDNESQLICEHMTLVNSKKEQKKFKEKVGKEKVEHTYQLGDSVYISTMDRTGIVCEQENQKGEIGVLVMKKRFKINKKRLSLHVDAKELYPEGYDLSIVLESKESRKLNQKMDKKHMVGAVRVISEADKKTE